MGIIVDKEQIIEEIRKKGIKLDLGQELKVFVPKKRVFITNDNV